MIDEAALEGRACSAACVGCPQCDPRLERFAQGCLDCEEAGLCDACRTESSFLDQDIDDDLHNAA